MVLLFSFFYDKAKAKKEDVSMNRDTENNKHNAEVAQFRFALIAPVVQGLYPDASATAYYKRVTAKPLTLPDGGRICRRIKVN